MLRKPTSMCPIVHAHVHLQVFGVTRDPFIIYTSNIFAILSLRALYGFVATVMSGAALPGQERRAWSSASLVRQQLSGI